ncbi:hypothetical protein [Bacillus alkalicellulosilyticus]|uniref:hypothetical protein n=1 Tax=Alkalihalobacterium alkalicellulosilyticum TaxID=1912214 RepID=UPI0011168EFB|nr:hypothetical protein [Bacillus alkalicellulosilyticus]
MEVHIINEGNGKVVKSYEVEDPTKIIDLIRKSGGIHYRDCTHYFFEPHFVFYQYIDCHFYIERDNDEYTESVSIYVKKE